MLFLLHHDAIERTRASSHKSLIRLGRTLPNGLQQILVSLRSGWAKLGGKPKLRAPFLTARGGVSHDRFDADFPQSFSYFFHLASAPFADSNQSKYAYHGDVPNVVPMSRLYRTFLTYDANG